MLNIPIPNIPLSFTMGALKGSPELNIRYFNPIIFLFIGFSLLDRFIENDYVMLVMYGLLGVIGLYLQELVDMIRKNMHCFIENGHLLTIMVWSLSLACFIIDKMCISKVCYDGDDGIFFIYIFGWGLCWALDAVIDDIGKFKSLNVVDDERWFGYIVMTGLRFIGYGVLICKGGIVNGLSSFLNVGGLILSCFVHIMISIRYEA